MSPSKYACEWETISWRGEQLRVTNAAVAMGADYDRLPIVLRILLENIVRTTTGAAREQSFATVRRWLDQRSSLAEIDVFPGRVLMHDTTSTPALVDIAAMRDALAEAGGNPQELNPYLPVQVSVDHSLAVEEYGHPDAPVRNIGHEIRRNKERYRFLKWAASSMEGVYINPPGTGIMHTINLEQLATVVTTKEVDGVRWAVPDLMIGTDSHTPMINGLGVMAWGVGGLEAQTVMFGMPTTMRIPDVVGVRLTGALQPGVVATDLALAITHQLRNLGVTGEFVEFCGPGLSTLTVGQRAVVANMAPEYGATTGYFPIDEQTLTYLRATGRPAEQVDLVETYAKATGLWFDPGATPEYTRIIEMDLADIVTSAAGPRRPQDLLAVDQIPSILGQEPQPQPSNAALPDFPVAIASITSCTNTTDPALLVAAGLLARRARRLGLVVPEWVKTSLAPGSPAAASYLKRAGLLEDLSSVGFDIVGFGCATCIGNSGPLTPSIVDALDRGHTSPVAVLSGNRNFPGRVHPDLDLGFLMSPPMVIAYALAGDARRDLTTEPIQVDPTGRPIYLDDLWPAAEEVEDLVAASVDPADYVRDFRTASQNKLWDAIDAPTGELYPWDEASTILRRPPFAAPNQGTLLGTYKAHPLLILGDDITTDHISPASAVPPESTVADYLVERGENRNDLNVFASRRGNWEVMVRGAFHNKSLQNVLAPGAPTAHTRHSPSGRIMPVWDAAQQYAVDRESVVLIAGDRYGMGSSRDWAAKAQRLLGIRAVLAIGYERIHRSNLIGMGILPLVITADTYSALRTINPDDLLQISATSEDIKPRATIQIRLLNQDRETAAFHADAAIETELEAQLLRNGGVIPTILRRLLPEQKNL